MSPAPTLLNDRYEVDDLIGRGGMADVHRAHDTVLGRTVAVKMLRDASADDAARFAHEARLLAAVDHPHIVRLLDAGVADHRPWIVLELVEGPTLSEVMGHTPVDHETVARIGRDIASALAHAHASGVVHRDVKPGNILIADDGTAKLTDFGIAKLADSAAAMTLSGHTIGTAAYLSPEQVRGEQVTGVGDIYALGLVLLEALTAVRAYPGSPIESAVARLSVAPLIPTSLPTGWPALIAAMTAMDPTERPSAVEVALRLEASPSAASTAEAAAAVQDDAESTRAVPVLQPGRRRAPRRARRGGGLVAAAAALVLVAGGVALTQKSGVAPVVADPSTSTPTPSASPDPATDSTPTPVATPVSMVTTSLDAIVGPDSPDEDASRIAEVEKAKKGKKADKARRSTKKSGGRR